MTALLEIKGLHAEIAGGRKIIQGLDLTVNKGEIHAIMGPNGAGKSTLSYVLAGKPGYEITAGEVYLNGEDLLAMEANERAAKGVFLAFQYPLEIPGVATLTFLRAAFNAQRKARGEEELSSPDLIKRVREIAKTLNIDAEMLKRPLNVGFSGGEKKRNETLQMALLQPSLCVLDETDSGLDIDALKVVANGVNALRSGERGMIVITHYQRLLDYIVPDIVHVFAAGRIVRTGGADLARELEATGYGQYQSEAAQSVGSSRMGVAIRKTKAELGLADLYQGARRYLPGGEEITAVRAAAFDRFDAVGLPHRRVEAWRYTDLRTQMKEAKRLASLPDDAAKTKAREASNLFAGAGFRKLVIVDGAFVPELSDLADLEPGLTIQPMADALAADQPLLLQRLGPVVPDDDPALALNTALAANGVVILVAPGTALSRPIHVAFVTTNWVATSMFTRSQVNIGAGASATLVESHQGPDGTEYQVNTALQLVVGDEARIDHVKVVTEGNGALHISSLLANIGARATFNQLGFVAGGSLVRNQLFVHIAGEGTVADIRGGSLLAGAQHADTTLAIEHAAENCQSRETFKAVVGDTARAVFQGKITVSPGAQKTDAKMMSRALLLSDEAEADSKPELEIFADDVQCGHGTTTGAIDDELLFYLMARGIPPDEAKALLIQAFIGEIIEGAANESVRAALTEAMLGWLGRREQVMHAAVNGSGYDVGRIRADFPILGMQVHGKPLVYLDNAASAQKPQAVLDRMNQVYTAEYANVHRGLHYLANAATEAYEGARAKVAAFLNAESPEQIIFTRGATEAVNLVAQTFGRERIGPGDEIVLSIMEHHANIIPWHFLRERQGAVIKWAPVDDAGNFLIDEFEKLLTPRTKMVAMTQMSNVLGTVVPVKDVIRIAHARGIPVLIDGSQAAVHMEVDVRDLDADFYCITGHKIYGPTGIGALYGKRELLASMPPFNGGGEMIREVSRDWVTYGDPPHRFEAGTPPIVEAAGLGAAIDYVASIGKQRIAAHEHDLVTYATEQLREINSLRIIGNAADKGAIVSFEMQGAHAHDFATVIDRSGVAVRAGTHCAMPLLERFGVTATCRASFAMYNTREEVDALVRALKKAQEFFS